MNSNTDTIPVYKEKDQNKYRYGTVHDPEQVPIRYGTWSWTSTGTVRYMILNKNKNQNKTLPLL